MHTLLRRADQFCFGPVDPIRLAAFRVCFTIALAALVIDRARTPYEWLTARGFHFSAENRSFFTPPPPPLLPEWLLWPFLAFFFAGIVLLLLGWRTRSTSLWVLFCVVYVTAADAESAFTLNKLFMLGYLVLALAPAPVPVAIDGRQVLRQSAWPLRVLQATLLIEYFTAGTCKIFHGDWLHLGFYHGDWKQNPDVLWSQVQGVYCTAIAAWMLRTLPRWVWSVQQYAALAFELLAPALFASRRFRTLGMLWGIGFHLMIGLTMYKVGLFSLQMVSFYSLFLSPERLHRFSASRLARTAWPSSRTW